MSTKRESRKIESVIDMGFRKYRLLISDEEEAAKLSNF